MNKDYLIDSKEFYNIAKSLVDEGLSYYYIGKACGFSSYIFAYKGFQVNSRNLRKLKKFEKEKSYHIAKKKMIDLGKGIRQKPRYVLEYEGFSNWEINKLKRDE